MNMIRPAVSTTPRWTAFGKPAWLNGARCLSWKPTGRWRSGNRRLRTTNRHSGGLSEVSPSTVATVRGQKPSKIYGSGLQPTAQSSPRDPGLRTERIRPDKRWADDIRAAGIARRGVPHPCLAAPGPAAERQPSADRHLRGVRQTTDHRLHEQREVP